MWLSRRGPAFLLRLRGPHQKRKLAHVLANTSFPQEPFSGPQTSLTPTLHTHRHSHKAQSLQFVMVVSSDYKPSPPLTCHERGASAWPRCARLRAAGTQDTVGSRCMCAECQLKRTFHDAFLTYVIHYTLHYIIHYIILHYVIFYILHNTLCRNFSSHQKF